MTDDLSAPLGLNKASKKRRRQIPLAVPQAIAGVLALFLAIFAAWVLLADNPLGGEPVAVVSADPPAKAASDALDQSGLPGSAQGGPDRPARYDGPGGSAANQDSQAAASAAPAAPSIAKTVTIIDGRSGKREEVSIPGAPDAKPPADATPAARDAKAAADAKTPAGAKAPADANASADSKAPISDDKAPAGSKAPVGSKAPAGKGANIDGRAAAEQRFAESSRHGLIPRIAADGTRPADAFARPVAADPAKPNMPQIAIVVGGLGVSASKTSDAIGKLPSQITLAFAPYGGEIDQIASRARDAGHELLLQVPMEPFDYPDNDPGPQTLLTSLDPAQNLDRLYWLMSRFRGYVGLANFMGARFTASEQSLSPVLRETAKRGLIYVDDGTSGRSLAGQIAGANNLPFAKADLTIDAVPTAADIDRALAKLEAVARERGLALGFAHALPVSIERIARWAKAAEGRGFALVPISAVASKSKSS